MAALAGHTPERGGLDWPDVQGAHEIVQLQGAGDGSTLPAGSIARASKRWTPGARPRYVAGLEQTANAAPSRLHSKVDPAWFASKTNTASVSTVGSVGPDVIEVSGAAVSTVQL